MSRILRAFIRIINNIINHHMGSPVPSTPKIKNNYTPLVFLEAQHQNRIFLAGDSFSFWQQHNTDKGEIDETSYLYSGVDRLSFCSIKTRWFKQERSFLT